MESEGTFLGQSVSSHLGDGSFLSCCSFVLVCLVSHTDQLKANFKIHPQHSQCVYSYVISAGAEGKLVSFVSFQLEDFLRPFQTFVGNNIGAVIFPSLPPVPQQDPVR